MENVQQNKWVERGGNISDKTVRNWLNEIGFT